MPQARSWEDMRREIEAILERRTGQGVAAWNAKIEEHRPSTEPELRAWLREQGVIGYSQDLLVMETFGYPDFFLATSDELIEGQYADRPALRPILDAILALAPSIGEVEVQARKTYVTLLTPRRTFASIEPRTRSRVDLGLRLPEVEPTGRVEATRSMGQGGMTARIPLATLDEVDDEVVGWLRRAYEVNL